MISDSGDFRPTQSAVCSRRVCLLVATGRCNTKRTLGAHDRPDRVASTDGIRKVKLRRFLVPPTSRRTLTLAMPANGSFAHAVV